MSAPQLPQSSLKLVSDTLSIYHTDSTIESIIVYNSTSGRLIGVSNDKVTLEYAISVINNSSTFIRNFETTPLGKANFAKVNFGSSTLIVVPSEEITICAITKK